MSWQFDDKALLLHLFGCILPLSLDILRVITDYLFRREVIPFQKDGITSYLRFGPVLISGEIAYEIRAYNDKEFHVFSTFETGVKHLEKNKFPRLRQEVVEKNTAWSDVFLTKLSGWYYYRYVFCPATKWTYIVRFSEQTNLIKISRRDKDGECHSLGHFTLTDIKKNIIKYSGLIEKYGEEWGDCPELMARLEDGERLKHWILREMKGPTIM